MVTLHLAALASRATGAEQTTCEVRLVSSALGGGMNVWCDPAPLEPDQLRYAILNP